MRREYEVKYQPSYQAGYQPEGRAARRLRPSLIRGLILNRVLPFEVGLIFIISLHNFFLVEKYMSKSTRLINVIYFDHVTRFLCSDGLKYRITLECDTALVITLSVSALH